MESWGPPLGSSVPMRRRRRPTDRVVHVTTVSSRQIGGHYHHRFIMHAEAAQRDDHGLSCCDTLTRRRSCRRRRGIVKPSLSLLPRSSSRFARDGSETRSTRVCVTVREECSAACKGTRMHNLKNVGWQANGAEAALPNLAHGSAEGPCRAVSERKAKKRPEETETYRFAVQHKRPIPPKVVDANHELYPPTSDGISLLGHSRAKTPSGVYNLDFGSKPAVWYWQVRAEAHRVCAAHTLR